ncbi:MAG TPA: tetratricopeptide repeat protein, partial [Steroidobacteraceae bacterium]
TLQKLPASTDLREILADVYAGADDLPKAEEQLRKLVDLKPHEFAYRYQLAMFYARSHNMDAAQRTYEQAVTALPDSDDAKLALVNFLTTQRTREQAEQTLRKYIQANPDKYELRLGLGALLTRAGAFKDASATYQDVIDRDPNGPSGMVARDRLARLYVAQNRIDDAQKLIAEVLQKSPRDDDALLLRGQIELARNDATAAIGDLRAVIRDQPGAVPVRQMLAQAYQVNNQPGLAEEQLRGAMEVAPTNTAVRLELSRVLLRTQRAEQAVTLLKESVQHQPKDTALREGLVQAYLAIHNVESAQTAVNDLQILAPEDPLGPYLAGEVALAQSRPADAEKDFEHALQLQPHAIEPLSALTRLQIARGESAKAIERLQAVLTKYPQDAQTLEMLGEVYLANREYPHAIESFTHAIESDSNRWQAYRNLGVAKAASGDTAGAVAAYEAGIKIAPGEAGLVVELGSYYEKHGRVDDAITLYNTFYRHDPQSRLAANNLAMLLATYKRDRASLDRARDLSAAFVSSDDGALLDTYGWVHFKRGEIQDAIPVLQRALTRAPDSKIIHYHLGMAELQNGQTANARANLETAVSGTANFAGVDEARTVLADLKRGAGAG